MVRDCLATSFPHVVVGVLLHVHAAFLYPSNGSDDCVQIKCAVRNCLGDNRPPLHFSKHMGKSSRPRLGHSIDCLGIL